MFKTKISKVGDETVLTLTPEMLALLGAELGDRIYVLRGDDGRLQLISKSSDVADGLEAGEVVMDENW